MGKKNFRLVLIGLVISLFGSAIQRFSFSLYLLEVSRDAAIFSNVLAVSVLPYLIFAPLAGSLADNKNKKHIMIALDLLSFLVILFYLVTASYVSNQVMFTAVIMFLLSTITTLYTPAVTTIIPEIVEKEGLMRANALVSQVASASNLGGPVLAGILYGGWGIAGVTFVNAISFFGSAILELFIVYKPEKREKTRISVRGSFVEMKDSFVYLRKGKSVSLSFILSYGLYNICLVPVLTILMPFVLRNLLGVSPQGYGVIEGIVAVGMIVGTSLISLFPTKFPVSQVHRWYYLMTAAIALMIGGASLGPHYWVVVLWTLAGFLIMMALGIGNVVTLSHTQHIMEKEYLGKVSAFSTAFATATIPVGQMLFGWYMELSGALIPLLVFVLVSNLAVTLFMRKKVAGII